MGQKIESYFEKLIFWPNISLQKPQKRPNFGAGHKFLNALYTLIWLQAFTSIISIIACVWFTAAAFSNGLGWMTGSNAPVEFVQSYVSAWKPAWCLDVGLCVNAVELGMAFYTLWAWMHMEPITEESEEGGSLFEYDEEVDDEIEKIKQRAKAKRLEQRLKQAEDREKEESLVYPSPSWKRYDPSKKQTQAGWI